MSKYYVGIDSKLYKDGEVVTIESLNEWQLNDVCEVLQEEDLLDTLKTAVEDKNEKIEQLEEQIENLKEQVEKLESSTKESNSTDFIIKVLIDMLLKKTDIDIEERQKYNEILQLIEVNLSGPDKNDLHINELKTHIQNVSFFKPKQLLDLLCKL